MPYEKKRKSSVSEKPLRLWYREPAPDDDGREPTFATSRNTGWEILALPIANSYAGTKIFGITDRERVQINENTLSTSGTTRNSGTTNMTELYLHFNHKLCDTENYIRELDIKTAISSVEYTHGGVQFSREYFASYPDKVTVISLKASEKGKLSFTVEPKIPYFKLEEKTGDVIAEKNAITLSGHLPGSNLLDDGKVTVGYEMDFEAAFRVFASGGSITAENPGGAVDEYDEYSNGKITVTNADSAYILVAVGTSYELCPAVFNGPNDKKLKGFPHPHKKVTDAIEKAAKKPLDELRKRHISDYTEMFSRVNLDLGGEVPDIPTDLLLEEYKAGRHCRYFEELIFAYGRYIHIASSRKGSMPSNLNGIWNRYHGAVCKNGYWHNINTQMNYWASFNTNLAECFEAYLGFYEAYAEPNHKESLYTLLEKGFIKSEEEVTGRLWSIQTGMTPFDAYPSCGGRDGWGNTPFMAELFWDYYEYTGDKKLLRERIFPAILASANFLSHLMKKQDNGLYLVSPSGSPEQSTTKPYLEYLEAHPGYVPMGCAYDQSLAYSNYLNVFKAIDELSLSDGELMKMGAYDTVCRMREQLDKLAPIVVGASGQVKEFREENYYGEIGEPEHRHISQLCALVQGSSMGNAKTPAWIDAAEVTMQNRGMTPHAWAYVMRIASWARIGDGDAGYKVLSHMLKTQFGKNLLSLLNSSKIFQVEGILGTPCAMAELLLQSHDGCIAPLPALPDEWSFGSYSGLVTRGAFELGAEWSDGFAKSFTVLSKAGARCTLKYTNVASSRLVDSDGCAVEYTKADSDTVSFDTVAGKAYVITDIPKEEATEMPLGLTVEKSDTGITLHWEAPMGARSYRIYAARENEPTYTLIADRVEATEYMLPTPTAQHTYAVTALSDKGRESRRAHTVYLI